ncbi:MAG: aminopeptidase [Haloglomus sp.]
MGLSPAEGLTRAEQTYSAGESRSLRAGNLHAENDYGERNLPGGEVYTAPVIDAVDGEVLFDGPTFYQGQEFRNVQVTLEDDEVVDHEAEAGAELPGEMFENDPGFQRLGGLGFGMDRQIDHPAKNVLLDEKTGATVHMALDKAIPWNGGENREASESDYHVDLIVDMSEDAFIEVDGERIYEDGWYVFEEGGRWRVIRFSVTVYRCVGRPGRRCAGNDLQ